MLIERMIADFNRIVRKAAQENPDNLLLQKLAAQVGESGCGLEAPISITASRKERLKA